MVKYLLTLLYTSSATHHQSQLLKQFTHSGQGMIAYLYQNKPQQMVATISSTFLVNVQLGRVQKCIISIVSLFVLRAVTNAKKDETRVKSQTAYLGVCVHQETACMSTGDPSISVCLFTQTFNVHQCFIICTDLITWCTDEGIDETSVHFGQKLNYDGDDDVRKTIRIQFYYIDTIR